MKLVTFNIRCDYNQDGENSFIYRREYIREKILTERPDVVCFQEVLPHVAAWLKQSLPGYYVIGCGRDAKLRDEQTSIAFRSDTWNLCEMKTYWLSPTPNVPASRFLEQSDCPRVCTEAVLEEMESGELYRIVSVHLDHIGAEARRLGMQELFSSAVNAVSFPNAHLIIAGDFNCHPQDAEFDVLAGFPGFLDAAAASGGTFHDYGRAVPEKIDYIFTRDLRTISLRVWNDKTGPVYLSDHYPVEAELVLKASD